MNHIDLKQFCADANENPAWMKEPAALDGKVFCGNRFMFVLFDDQINWGFKNVPDDKKDLITGVFKTHIASSYLKPDLSTRPFIPNVCRECCGHGLLSFHTGFNSYQFMCTNCKGKGAEERFNKIETIQIHSVHLAKWMFSKIITLPSVRFADCGDFTLKFMFNGGIGFVKGVNLRDKKAA